MLLTPYPKQTRQSADEPMKYNNIDYIEGDFTCLQRLAALIILPILISE